MLRGLLSLSVLVLLSLNTHRPRGRASYLSTIFHKRLELALLRPLIGIN